LANGLKVRFWGVRGSISCSGPEYTRYGGNTSCLEVTAGGRRLIFDAGSGIRPLGLELARQAQRPALGSAHEHRGLAALPQSAQERLGPEVLVDVGRAAQGGAG